MEITFDPRKRHETPAGRGLAFEVAAEVFDGEVSASRMNPRDYGEDRIVSVGFLRGRMVILVWTPRGEARHVISMGTAIEREPGRYCSRFGADRCPDHLGPGE